MPCMDLRVSSDTKDTKDTRTINTTSHPEERHGMTIAAFEATMCGLFTAIEKWGNDTTPEGRLKMMLDKVDWTETGVNRKTVEIWWKKHKAEDENRRALEEAENRKAKLKASALRKLTRAEKAALGI